MRSRSFGRRAKVLAGVVPGLYPGGVGRGAGGGRSAVEAGFGVLHEEGEGGVAEKAVGWGMLTGEPLEEVWVLFGEDKVERRKVGVAEGVHVLTCEGAEEEVELEQAPLRCSVQCGTFGGLALCRFRAIAVAVPEKARCAPHWRGEEGINGRGGSRGGVRIARALAVCRE